MSGAPAAAGGEGPHDTDGHDGPSREQLDMALAALPGDGDGATYTDPDWVVRGMSEYFGDLFTAADEALVRDRVKPLAPVTEAAPVAPEAWQALTARAQALSDADRLVCHIHHTGAAPVEVMQFNGAGAIVHSQSDGDYILTTDGTKHAADGTVITTTQETE